MNIPIGPIRYVIKRGNANKNLFIKSFWASLSIHPPTNKLIETKWVQNINK